MIVRRAPGCLPLCFAAALLLGPSHAVAEDGGDGPGWFVPAGTPANNFYAGAGIGYGDIDYPDSNQDGSVTGVSTDDSDTVFNFYGGYQINDTVSVQGGYHDFGESDFAGVSDGSGDSWVAGDVSATLDSDGWELAVLGRWPIGNRWYLLGQLGWLWWDSTETFVENGVVSTESSSGSDFSYGAGLEYDVGLNERIVYRFMGTHHEVDNDGYDVKALRADIVYRFP